MDQSSNQNITGAHAQPTHNGAPYNGFIDDLQTYTGATDNHTADEYSNFSNNFSWDPALFNSDALGPGFSQPSRSTQANFTQSISRQDNESPALPRYQPSQPSYPQQSPYSQPFYDARGNPQPTFDDRFVSRPSASPGPFEQYSYHAPMNYGVPQSNYMSQPYQQQQPPPQQPANPQYAMRQQGPTHSFVNLAARPQSQLSHMQNADSATFHHYQPGQPAASFVNPSMLNTNNTSSRNGAMGSIEQQHQQAQLSQYFGKAGGVTVDPQLLQQMQLSNQLPNMPPGQQHAFIQQGQATMPPTNGQGVNPPTVPKVSKTKISKVKKVGSSKSVGDSDSAGELEIEDEPPEKKPALLTVTAPTEMRGQALYNAVNAVWSPRNKPVTSEHAGIGIAAWGETVRKLRDAWKAKNDALKKAELPNSTTAADASQLKQDVAHYRQVMENVMSRSLQYGHDSIVKRLGENQFALAALYSFMLDRNNVGDYDSTLVHSILKFAVKFTTIDEEMLEVVKWTKILQKFTKKATNESKDLAKQILANATALTVRKRNTGSGEGPASPGSANGSKTGIEIKRNRDGEAVSKKPVKPASKPLALQHMERAKALEKKSVLEAGKAGKTGVDGKAIAAVARPKVAMTAPLKNNAFAGLLSASKKPGTSNAEKAAAKEKDKAVTVAATNGAIAAVKREEVKRESPPRTVVPVQSGKSASSFMGFLADMEKPKETEVKKIEVIPNETEEERRKRLRKEARSKLRVTWKPDHDLVETRLFTHDPDEETGHEDSMMRDAGNTRKEGEMLKLHKGADPEDDEDEEAIDDLEPYTPPTRVDLSDIMIIDGEPSQHFIKTGGTMEPESLAVAAQDKYEANTLMAMYSFKSDRPDTPKELPSVNDDDDFSPSVDFGEPDDKTRRREKEILARRQPIQPVSNGLDLAAQLRAVSQQTAQPQQQPTLFGNMEQLQRTLGLFNPQAQQPTPAPAAGMSGIDFAKIMAAVKQTQQAQVQPQPQYNIPPPQPTPMNIPANLAALVAQVAGTQPQSQQPAPLPLGSAGNPNPFPGGVNYHRKHGRSDEGDGNQGIRKKNKVPIGEDGKPLNYKTLPCQFWKEGKCIKGDACTYRHDE